MIRRPPRSTLTDTRLPYATPFRSSRAPLWRRTGGACCNRPASPMRAPRYAAGSPIGCALVHSPVDEALVIAGGGPAGTAAALTLARAGQSPLVIERGEAADEKLRSEERRVGKACVSTCRYRGEPVY